MVFTSSPSTQALVPDAGRSKTEPTRVQMTKGVLAPSYYTTKKPPHLTRPGPGPVVAVAEAIIVVGMTLTGHALLTVIIKPLSLSAVVIL